MLSAPLLAPKLVDSSFEDTVGHFYCIPCFPQGDMSWCGKDISGDPVADSDEEVDCVVCIGLRHCQRCFA